MAKKKLTPGQAHGKAVMDALVAALGEKSGKIIEVKSKAVCFEVGCVSLGIMRPVAEYRFHPTRRWRFDYAWPEALLALEVNGGVFTKGRHTRGLGYVNDMEKLSEAAILGWRVLQCQPKDVKSGLVYDLVKRALEWKRC